MSFRKPCHMPFLVLSSPLLIRPKRAFLRVRWVGWSWVWVKILNVVCLNRIRKDFWRWFIYTAKRVKKSIFKSSMVGVTILHFCKGVNSRFWVKIGTFVFDCFFFLNRIRKNVWQCLRLIIRPKRAISRVWWWEWPYWIFA